MEGGRGVLITGGTGYLASGLLKKILKKNEISRICLYSRGEFRQAQMRMEFSDERIRWFIGDVRDVGRLRRAMEGVEVVIHAAALKRIEVGAYNPDEMVKTNVVGSQNVVEAARGAGVGKVVLVSSDKAVGPVSPYGQTKALAESLFLTADVVGGTRFSVCRYGNVAGSTGSVVPTWRVLRDRGEAVPVTDPECTRFWMRLEEAVDLVWGEAEKGGGGGVVVPTLPAFRLGDLAEAMEVKIRVTGLGRFEKRHESLSEGVSSDRARRMTVDELRRELREIG